MASVPLVSDANSAPYGCFGATVSTHSFAKQDGNTGNYVYRKVGLTPAGVALADAALVVVNDATKVAKGDKQRFIEAICKVLMGNVEEEATQRTDEKDTSFIKKNANLGAGLALLTMGPSMPGSGKIDRSIAIPAARATWAYTKFIKPGKYTDSVETRAIEGVLDSKGSAHNEYQNKDRWRSSHLREAIAATQDPTITGLDQSMDGVTDSMVRTSFANQIASMQSPAKSAAGAQVKKLVLEALGSLVDKQS